MNQKLNTLGQGGLLHKSYDPYKIRFLDQVDLEINKYLDFVERNQPTTKRILVLPVLSEFWQIHVEHLVLNHFKSLKTLKIKKTGSSRSRIGILLGSYTSQPSELESDFCVPKWEGEDKVLELTALQPPPERTEFHRLGLQAVYGSSAVWTDYEYEAELIKEISLEQPSSNRFWTVLSKKQVRQVVREIGRCKIIKPTTWCDFGFDVAMDFDPKKYRHMVEAYDLKLPEGISELQDFFLQDHYIPGNFFVQKVNSGHAILIFSEKSGSWVAQYLTTHYPAKFRPIILASKATMKLLKDSVVILTPPPASRSMEAANRMIRNTLGLPSND